MSVIKPYQQNIHGTCCLFSEQCNHVIAVRKDQALSLNALKLLQQVIYIHMFANQQGTEHNFNNAAQTDQLLSMFVAAKKNWWNFWRYVMTIHSIKFYLYSTLNIVTKGTLQKYTNTFYIYTIIPNKQAKGNGET